VCISSVIKKARTINASLFYHCLSIKSIKSWLGGSKRTIVQGESSKKIKLRVMERYGYINIYIYINSLERRKCIFFFVTRTFKSKLDIYVYTVYFWKYVGRKEIYGDAKIFVTGGWGSYFLFLTPIYLSFECARAVKATVYLFKHTLHLNIPTWFFFLDYSTEVAEGARGNRFVIV